MKRLVISVVALATLVGAATAASETSVSMRVTGAKQGAFLSDVFGAGGNSPRGISVISFDHRIYAPYDIATGALTGKRVHQPFTIKKRVVNGNWVQFHEALASGELLPAVYIDVITSNGDGTEEKTTIMLKNAVVEAVEDTYVDTAYLAATVLVPAHQEVTVSFNYQKIEWTYQTLSAGDSWNGNLARRIGAGVGHLALR